MQSCHRIFTLKNKTLTTLAGLAVLTVCLFPSLSHAGKEGVFINDGVYFTLENVTMSSGAEAKSLRFTLELTNGSKQIIDFNNYGVRVDDSEGNGYTAELSERGAARVGSNQVQDYKFISQIPPEASFDQLKVTIFAWDSSAANYRKDIGALSVSGASATNQVTQQQVVVNLDDIDANLPDDSLVSFELVKSYKIYKDGAWNIFIDLQTENLSSASFKLPTGLLFNLKDQNSLAYTAAVAYGGDQTLLPKQINKLTLQAAIPENIILEGVSLQLTKKVQNVTTVLGSMALNGSLSVTKLDESKAYWQPGVKGLAVSTGKLSAAYLSDGQHVQSTVTLSNTGSQLISVPVLTSFFQFGSTGFAAATIDSGTHPGFLAPNETTSFRFAAVLPAGIPLSALQQVLLDKKSTTPLINIPIAVVDMAGASVLSQNSPLITEDYTFGRPFVFDVNTLVNADMNVSLVELHRHQNDDLGYQTVIAKFKFTNKGNAALTIPALQTELMNNQGDIYTGTRQSANAIQLMPNTSYVLSYSYLTPATESGEQLSLHFYDDKSLAISKQIYGSYRVLLQEEVADGAISFYPFQINIKDWSISTLFTKADATYSYKLKLSLEVNRLEQVVVDNNFSKIEFDLVDSFGSVLAAQSLSFMGTQKLVTGQQIIFFKDLKTEQFESNMTIKFYETIETPTGTAKRLVKTINPQEPSTPPKAPIVPKDPEENVE